METNLGSKLEIEKASDLCLVPQDIIEVKVRVDQLRWQIGLARLLDEGLDFLQAKQWLVRNKLRFWRGPQPKKRNP